MIDIHNHTLFGVDDGPREQEESLAMLREAAAAGITGIILTPHYRKQMFPYDREQIRRNLAELTAAVQEEGLPLKLHLGCELHIHGDMLEQLRAGRVATLAGSRYVLLEFGYDDSFDTVNEAVHRMTSAGYEPIVAHVERIGCLRKKPRLCEELQYEGAWIQCNSQAVLGREGLGAKLFTAKLIKHQWIDLIASDAHNRDKRPNSLPEAYEYVVSRYGERCARVLMEENPAQILKDKKEKDYV